MGGWVTVECEITGVELTQSGKDRWHLNSINYSAFGHLVAPRGNEKQ